MDWQLTCRVCLETGEMVSFFDWDENNEQLCDKYTYCCGVEIPKNDSLPTLICLNCVDRLTIAYQFKQQCLSSNETLKECLDEFRKTSAVVATNNSTVTETETITIKQENGLLLQYELPVEHDPQSQWTRALSKASGNAVVTKAPGPKKRGRPRKYPDHQGQIITSPYNWKKGRDSTSEPEALTKLLASGGISLKEEPTDEIDEEPFANDEFEDPDFLPGDDDDDDTQIKEEDGQPKKRGRPRKNTGERPRKHRITDDGEDVLLQETIMAYSEPIPDHILNPKPKTKRPQLKKKKYVYEKTHVCETCGQSFTSNASLQGHIRRHLGIKPYVCSVCDYSCVMKEALKRHMLRHTGEKPYKCRICERRFGDFGTRQKHERLHMGVRPYQCTLCGKSFTYSYVLGNHMLTHTGEKKYSCTPCNKKFTKAHHLKYHNKIHHKEVYIQQQLEMEAKKMAQQMRMSGISGAITGQIVDGALQLVQASEVDAEHENQMQVVEEDHAELDDDPDKETDRAVAGMQGVIIDGVEGIVEDEDDKTAIVYDKL